MGPSAPRGGAPPLWAICRLLAFGPSCPANIGRGRGPPPNIDRAPFGPSPYRPFGGRPPWASGRLALGPLWPTLRALGPSAHVPSGDWPFGPPGLRPYRPIGPCGLWPFRPYANWAIRPMSNGQLGFAQPALRAFALLAIWPLAQLTYGLLATWPLAQLALRASAGKPAIRPLGPLVLWASWPARPTTYRGPFAYGHLGFWAFGLSGHWPFGPFGAFGPIAPSRPLAHCPSVLRTIVPRDIGLRPSFLGHLANIPRSSYL